MFDAIKSWFSGPQTEENKWDATTVQMQQPNSPAAMNETVTQQPTAETMDVHVRGGGEGEDVCCGV
ncbi:uncharacterized protein N7483_009194 [Penicillium malachiteum]|uniref:uncharacterized protein n=1 Tax=Penicillium malachiteum TaxID=1324776 RepID=UPI002548A2DF|nr:uncharacterized protein N7483_009194 [Penicillium malachiteum]KAJ5721260.1 hypothetical protein N7483_009194 [Penicillium malachiteum]